MQTAPPAIDDANFHLLFPLLSFLRGRRAARRPLTLFIIYLSRPRGPFSARALVLASPPPSFRHFPFVRDLKESSTQRANKRANNVALNLRQLVSTSSLVCLTIHAPRPPFLPGQPTSQSAVISHSSEPLNPNPEGSQHQLDVMIMRLARARAQARQTARASVSPSLGFILRRRWVTSF